MFESLSEAELEEVRSSMHRFENGMEEADTQAPLDVNEVSKNLRARAFHLAEDPEPQRVLEGIFGDVPSNAL